MIRGGGGSPPFFYFKMKILFHIPLFLPDHVSGAEYYVYDYAQEMLARGHEIMVVCDRSSVNELDGIKIHAVQNPEIFNLDYNWADVILTHLGRVGTAVNHCSTYRDGNKTIENYNKALIHICHNNLKNSLLESKYWIGIIHNSEWTKETRPYPNNPSALCRPALIKEFNQQTSGSHITLINLNENKGGKQLKLIAEKLPEYKFIGIKGSYAGQVTDQPANVMIIENGMKMKKIWAETKIIIMPSLYEAYGRVAVEAISRGIPVVAHPAGGLLESLGDAGIFHDRNDIDSWCETIRNLMTDPKLYSIMQKKAKKQTEKIIEQGKEDVNNFEELLYKMTKREKELVPNRQTKELKLQYENK